MRYLLAVAMGFGASTAPLGGEVARPMPERTAIAAQVFAASGPVAICDAVGRDDEKVRRECLAGAAHAAFEAADAFVAVAARRGAW